MYKTNKDLPDILLFPVKVRLRSFLWTCSDLTSLLWSHYKTPFIHVRAQFMMIRESIKINTKFSIDNLNVFTLDHFQNVKKKQLQFLQHNRIILNKLVWDTPHDKFIVQIIWRQDYEFVYLDISTCQNMKL